MLVLTRKVDGVICIGDDIKVHVVQIKGKQVRLGFTAPDHVKINREEVIRGGIAVPHKKKTNGGDD